MTNNRRYGLCVDFNHFNNSFPKDVAVDTGLKLILKIDVSDSIKASAINFNFPDMRVQYLVV